MKYRITMETRTWRMWALIAGLGCVIYIGCLAAYYAVAPVSLGVWYVMIPVLVATVAALGLLAGMTEILCERIYRIDELSRARVVRGYLLTVISAIVGGIMSLAAFLLVSEDKHLATFTRTEGILLGFTAVGGFLCALAAMRLYRAVQPTEQGEEDEA